MYITKCPANNCNDDYVGETGPPISEGIVGYNGRDINSHLAKHDIEKKSTSVFRIKTLLLLAVVFRIIQ